jgi:DNA-directed RNA polymerase subunit beta
MNIGQILETHLGWVAQMLGMKVLTPVFDGAKDNDIESGLARAWLIQKAGAVQLDPLDEKAILDLEAKARLTQQDSMPKRWMRNNPDEARRRLRLWLDEVGIPSTVWSYPSWNS